MTISMVVFYALCATFVLVLAYAVSKNWYRGVNTHQVMPDDRLIGIAKARLHELQADLTAGRIDEQVFQSLKVQLERQILSDDVRHHAVLALTEKSTTPGWAFIPMIVVLALSFYGVNVWWVTRADHVALWRYWQATDQFAQEADALLTQRTDQPSDAAMANPGALLQAAQTNAYQHGFDATRWLALSELYAMADVPNSAINAAAHAYRLAPDNDAVALTNAKLRLMLLHGKMDESTEQMIQSVLVRHPQHAKALSLLAMGELGNHHFERALGLLQQIKDQWLQQATAPNRDEAVRQLDQAMAMVQAAQLKATQEKTDAMIKANIQLDPGLVTQVQPNTTLFVFVKAMTGNGKPYLVKKLSGADVAELLQHQGIQLTLTNRDAMLNDRNLTTAQQEHASLVLMARMSQHANPLRQAGDVESLPVPIHHLNGDVIYQVNLDQSVH